MAAAAILGFGIELFQVQFVIWFREMYPDVKFDENLSTVQKLQHFFEI